MADRLSPVPRRLLGLGMIALVVAVLGTCVAVYNKAFTDEMLVTVQIDQVDNSFLPNAEVRLRGVSVGTVDSADVRGGTAMLHLALDPAKATKIPANVRAMILPKSLFGESFLSLEVPGDPAPRAIAAGDVIPRDRSGKAVQTEQLFTNLLPLIQAVKPDDLATTLGGLSQGLTGRGQQLGDTVRQLHQYLIKFNQTLPDLTTDVRALPPLTDTYSKAAPDLVEALKYLNTTSDTLVQRQADFDTLYDTVTRAGDNLTDFFDTYGDDVIDLSRDVRPTVDLLARYSPEFECLFTRLANAIPQGKKVFKEGNARPALGVRVAIAASRGKYLPHRDEPEITDKRGPACYNNNAPIEQYPGGPAEDGSAHPPAAVPGSGTLTEPQGGGDNQRLHFYYDEDRGKRSIDNRGGPPTPNQLPLLGDTGSGAPAASGPPILLRGAEERTK